MSNKVTNGPLGRSLARNNATRPLLRPACGSQNRGPDRDSASRQQTDSLTMFVRGNLKQIGAQTETRQY
jgi:hypothetical protein